MTSSRRYSRNRGADSENTERLQRKDAVTDYRGRAGPGRAWPGRTLAGETGARMRVAASATAIAGSKSAAAASRRMGHADRRALADAVCGWYAAAGNGLMAIPLGRARGRSVAAAWVGSLVVV